MPVYNFNSGQSGGSAAYPGLGGPIQRYGQANPYGPYAMLPRAGQSPPIIGGGGSSGGGSTGGGGDSTARRYLEGVVGGQNTPYNQTTRDNMYAQQSNMAAGAETGRNNQIAEQSAMGGASPTDPSYQRLIRQSAAQRQGQNQQSMGAIDSMSNIANQQAQMGAADRLLGSEDERYALQQGYNQRATQMAMGYLYGNGGGGGGGQSTPNQGGFWGYY